MSAQNETFTRVPDGGAADSTLPSAPEPTDTDPSLLGTPRRIVFDFVHLVQFPGHIRGRDEKWLLPLTAATATAFALDEKTMSEVVTANPSTNATSGNVSDALLGGFISAPILMYGAGLTKHNEHLREAGLLGGEAMVDAYVAGDLIKLVSFRERPNVDRSEGSFYRTSAGQNSSFISGHSLIAWSSAAVIASEYPKRWVQVSAYTAAAGVSLTRVLGKSISRLMFCWARQRGGSLGGTCTGTTHERTRQISRAETSGTLSVETAFHNGRHGRGQRALPMKFSIPVLKNDRQSRTSIQEGASIL